MWFFTEPNKECLTQRSICVYCFHQDTKCVRIITFLVLLFGAKPLMGILYNSKISKSISTGLLANSNFRILKDFNIFLQTSCFLPHLTNVLINLLNQNDLNNKFL